MQRWTVGATKTSEERVVNLDVDDDDTDDMGPVDGALQRWVTEEDLTAGLCLTNAASASDDGVRPADGLSNIHSESTDSGIHSVGDAQEDKSKLSATSPGAQDQPHQRSLIHQIFGGKMTTTYRCLACGTASHHQDFFTDLHLAFPDPTEPAGESSIRNDELSLDRLLQSYFTAEKLQGDNRYHVIYCSFLSPYCTFILTANSNFSIESSAITVPIWCRKPSASCG